MDTTPTSRRSAPRRNNNLAIIIGIAVAAVLVIGLIAFVGCSGDDDKNPAAGSTGATASASKLVATGLAKIQTGDLPGAKEDFEQAAELDPKNKFAPYNLGYIAQTQGDQSEAETQYEAAVALDKRFDSALYNLAIIRTANNKIEEAITLYRQAIGANGDNANAHFNLGLLLRQTGKTEEGNTQVQMAVALNPELAQAANAQGVPTSAG